MSRPKENIYVLQSPKLDVGNTGANVYAFNIPTRCTIQKVSASCPSVQSSNAHISLDSYVGTTQGAEDIGSIEIPANAVIFKQYFDVAGAGVSLKAGDAVLVQVDDAGDSGEFFVVSLVLEYEPETDANMTGQTETA